MYADQLEQPKAWAILDHRNVMLFNFSNLETLYILDFLSIPSIQDILVSKYESHIEFIITLDKVTCLDSKLTRQHKLFSIVTSLLEDDNAQISNSLTKYESYDHLIIKCKFNAINQ
jgi:hypothetical protein